MTIIDRDTLLAVLPKPGVPALICKPPMQARFADARRLRAAKDQLTRLISVGEAFILIDEEHLRSQLPHTAAIPFLENNGQYWGPPADDATAIRELERLRRKGAHYLAIVWSSFWWLDHYVGFHRHLREKFRCVLNSEELILFALQPS